jgi:ribonucleotide monophosphatase NagD (HAD superfamily)
LIREEGATFYGTNPDVTFPAPQGLQPGAGSVIAMIATAAEVAPIIVGKPEQGMFTSALQRMESDPAHTLMVGDRLNTDIEGAQRAGLHTALVMTGVTDSATLEASDIQPDAVYDNLVALQAAWQGAIAE